MAATKAHEPEPPKLNYLFGASFFATRDELAKLDREQAFKNYLEYLSQGNTKVYSRRRAGLSDHQIENKRNNNSEFRGAEERALEDGADMLEQEAIRRGKDGYQKAVWYKGEEVGTETQYSDTLLLAVLKAKKANYRESRSVVQAEVANTHTVQPDFDPSKLTDDELLKLEELLSKSTLADG